MLAVDLKTIKLSLLGSISEKEKLFITRAEYGKMIKTLTEQMRLAAESQEYHRAAMIKDRIRELEEEMKKTKI